MELIIVVLLATSDRVFAEWHFLPIPPPSSQTLAEKAKDSGYEANVLHGELTSLAASILNQTVW